METLEKGKEKLSEICDLLRKETLEPAQNDAKSIIEGAHKEKEQILKLARKEAESLIQESREKIEKEKVLFHTSMDVASKQTFSKLKQEIEQKLFNDELKHLVNEIAQDTQKVAQLVNVLVEVIEREGLNGNLTLGLANSIRPEELNKYLTKSLLEKIQKNEVPIESISGGAVVRLEDKKLTFDISDQALKELMGTYLRSSFREILFKNV